MSKLRHTNQGNQYRKVMIMIMKIVMMMMVIMVIVIVVCKSDSRKFRGEWKKYKWKIEEI